MARLGSIHHRFLALVLLGAVLPLALTGGWLARSTVRSAESLLRMQLDTSLTTIAATMERRWEYRRGDLLMLAENDVTRRLMRTAGARISPADSSYLTALHSAVSSTIPSLRFRGAGNTLRWEIGAARGDRVARATGALAVNPRADARMAVSAPIPADSGAIADTLDAEIRLSALLPVDSIPLLLSGAELSVTERRSGDALTFPGLGAAPSDGAVFARSGERWIAQHRTIANSLLVVTAAAPTRAFVAPFERSARIGLYVLLAIVLATMLLTVFFTARITQSLERLANAADAVAGGDLAHHVEASGDHEVGRLARSFNTMTDSLRRTLNELAQREALAAVGEFATMLSHEVRNGLTAVRVDLERAEESGLTAPQSHALVSRSLRNVLRLNGTVTGALAVARSGRSDVHLVDLRDVLRAAIAGAESTFASSHTALDANVETAQAAIVRGDAIALEQLFLNLILNAAQAMPGGAHAQLTLTVSASRAQVDLCDRGPGLSEDELTRVGQPFVSSKPGGTGLGLSIAKKIASAHGGTLQLENAIEGGLRVRVQLPLA